MSRRSLKELKQFFAAHGNSGVKAAGQELIQIIDEKQALIDERIADFEAQVAEFQKTYDASDKVGDIDTSKLLGEDVSDETVESPVDPFDLPDCADDELALTRSDVDDVETPSLDEGDDSSDPKDEKEPF